MIPSASFRALGSGNDGVSPELIRASGVISLDPQNVVVTLRTSADGKTIAIHLVNGNFDEFSHVGILKSVWSAPEAARFLRPFGGGGSAHARRCARQLQVKQLVHNLRIAVSALLKTCATLWITA